MGRCRHPVPSEGKKRSTEFVFIAGKLIKVAWTAGEIPEKPLFYKGIWRSILGPSTFSKINWAAIIKAIWNNLEKKGELFMLEMLQTGKALYALAAIGAIGAISKLITRSLYKRLIRETDNMAMTKTGIWRLWNRSWRMPAGWIRTSSIRKPIWNGRCMDSALWKFLWTAGIICLLRWQF